MSSSLHGEVACNACKCYKLHKIPFYVSTWTSHVPLELIYLDVWGSSSIQSFDGFCYYVVFIDHITKYLWLFPTKFKLDVLTVFKKFKLVVEKYFQKPIMSYGGGEFITVKKNKIESHGISHFIMPPYTPEHNGFSECHHHHIRETSLTLLTQASLPFQFWSYAFMTIAYLINRMPTFTLSFHTPFAKLFGCFPN